MVGMMFDSNMSSAVFWIFMIIGSTLTSVIYGVVTNRGFKGVSRSIIMGVVASAVITAVAVIGVTGAFGYSKQVPIKQNIEKAYINAFGEQITFDDPQTVLDLHNAILENDAAVNSDDEPYRNIETVILNYQLKNGTTLSREFDVLSIKVKDELFKIYKSDERLKMIKEEIPIKDATQLSLYFSDSKDHYYTVSLTKTEAQEFLDVYWQDVLNCGNEIFSEYTYNNYELSGYIQTTDNYFGFALETFDTFTNTDKFIKEHNLVERALADEKN